MVKDFGISFLKMQIDSFKETGHLALTCNGRADCQCSRFNLELAEKNLNRKKVKFLSFKQTEDIKREK